MERWSGGGSRINGLVDWWINEKGRNAADVIKDLWQGNSAAVLAGGDEWGERFREKEGIDLVESEGRKLRVVSCEL